MSASTIRSRWDPIVLFVLLGAGLAFLHVKTRPPPDPGATSAIVVTDADVAWLEEAFERTRFRPPTDEELRGLVDRHIRDALLYREATALGLDREDAALRRRLAMKLEYLAKDVASAYEPTEAELQAWLDAHPERYAVDPRRAFTQVYLSTDKRGPEAEMDAAALLARLRGPRPPEATEVGDPILLESRQPPMTLAEVGRQFGQAFADALFRVPVGGWEGPLVSGFGLHLVRVDEAQPGAAAILAAVRRKVLDDVLTEKKRQAVEAFVEALRKKYGVDVQARRLRGADDAP